MSQAERRLSNSTDWQQAEDGYFYKPGNPTPHYRNIYNYTTRNRMGTLVEHHRYVYTPKNIIRKPKDNHELKKEVLQRLKKYRVCDPNLIPIYEKVKRLLDKYETQLT